MRPGPGADILRLPSAKPRAVAVVVVVLALGSGSMDCCLVTLAHRDVGQAGGAGMCYAAAHGASGCLDIWIDCGWMVGWMAAWVNRWVGVRLLGRIGQWLGGYWVQFPDWLD
ncbi:hypothetical protein EDC01DRAFT_675020 [Geopyxis carbonaria]|nr:hypothetical protein EDC01DRAFT_675020 [Geopyxis carbonaria]